MTRTYSCIFALALLLASGVSESANATAVGVLVEHIETDEATATRLIRELPPAYNAQALRDALESQIRTGDAKVVDVAYQLNSPGRRSIVESVHELIYPHDWGSASIAKEFQTDVTAGMRFKVPGNPGPFATRNLGNRFECEANLIYGEDPMISLSLSTETGWLSTRHSFGSEGFEVESPQFEIRKINCRFECRERQPILIGLHTPRDLEERTRRVFVFATAFLIDYIEWIPEEDSDPFERIEPEAEEAIDSEEYTVSSISAGVEFIEVDQSDLAALLKAIPRLEGEKSTVRNKVEALIEQGRAKVFASQSLKTTPGQRATSRPGHELSFPNELEPAEVAEIITPEMITSGERLTFDAVPTGYEQRYLGLSFGCEPSVDLEELISPGIHASYLGRIGTVEWGKEEAKTEHPVFSLIRLGVTHPRTRAGEDRLAAILTPRDDETGRPVADRRILIFFWADLAKKTIRVEQQDERPPRRQAPADDPFGDL